MRPTRSNPRPGGSPLRVLAAGLAACACVAGAYAAGLNAGRGGEVSFSLVSYGPAGDVLVLDHGLTAQDCNAERAAWSRIWSLEDAAGLACEVQS